MGGAPVSGLLGASVEARSRSGPRRSLPPPSTPSAALEAVASVDRFGPGRRCRVRRALRSAPTSADVEGGDRRRASRLRRGWCLWPPGDCGAVSQMGSVSTWLP
uniref:Uncharacterized protein n=1 Tax=Arundo donax TaxID=35708 RepID=A0A0A9U2I7_ARUDO